jgi:hypothetical protein
MSSTSSAPESSTPTTVKYGDKTIIESSPTNKPKQKIFYIKEDNGSFKQVGRFVKFGTEVKDGTVQTVYFSNNHNLPYVIGEHVFYTQTIGGGRRKRHTKHAAKSSRRRRSGKRVRKTRR